MSMEKYDLTSKTSVAYSQTEVHSWKPPCSCGVELDAVLPIGGRKVEVHSWKPPCSCGVSLDEVAEN